MTIRFCIPLLFIFPTLPAAAQLDPQLHSTKLLRQNKVAAITRYSLSPLDIVNGGSGSRDMRTTFNPNGDKLSETYFSGADTSSSTTTLYRYDSRNRILEIINRPAGYPPQTTTYQYDDQRRTAIETTRSTFSGQRFKELYYDAKGRLIKEVQKDTPNITRTTTHYFWEKGLLQRRRSYSAFDTNIVTEQVFHYDDDGREQWVEFTQNPYGMPATTAQFNRRGQLIQQVTDNGAGSVYITEKTWKKKRLITEVSYDSQNNQRTVMKYDYNYTGLLQQITNTTTKPGQDSMYEQYEYDGRHRLIKTIRFQGGRALHTTRFDYDGRDRNVREALFNGSDTLPQQVKLHSYDTAGHITATQSITRGLPETHYSPRGPRVLNTRTDSTTVLYEYHAGKPLAEYQVTNTDSLHCLLQYGRRYNPQVEPVNKEPNRNEYTNCDYYLMITDTLEQTRLPQGIQLVLRVAIQNIALSETAAPLALLRRVVVYDSTGLQHLEDTDAAGLLVHRMQRSGNGYSLAVLQLRYRYAGQWRIGTKYATGISPYTADSTLYDGDGRIISERMCNGPLTLQQRDYRYPHGRRVFETIRHGKDLINTGQYQYNKAGHLLAYTVYTQGGEVSRSERYEYRNGRIDRKLTGAQPVAYVQRFEYEFFE